MQLCSVSTRWSGRESRARRLWWKQLGERFISQEPSRSPAVSHPKGQFGFFLLMRLKKSFYFVFLLVHVDVIVPTTICQRDCELIRKMVVTSHEL